MAYNLKKELEKPERLAGGHRLLCRMRRRDRCTRRPACAGAGRQGGYHQCHRLSGSIHVYLSTYSILRQLHPHGFRQCGGDLLRCGSCL